MHGPCYLSTYVICYIKHPYTTARPRGRRRSARRCCRGAAPPGYPLAVLPGDSLPVLASPTKKNCTGVPPTSAPTTGTVATSATYLRLRAARRRVLVTETATQCDAFGSAWVLADYVGTVLRGGGLSGNGDALDGGGRRAVVDAVDRDGDRQPRHGVLRRADLSSAA
jgi:hypothetical protein